MNVFHGQYLIYQEYNTETIDHIMRHSHIFLTVGYKSGQNHINVCVIWDKDVMNSLYSKKCH